ACPVSPVVIRPYPTCDTNGAPPTAEYKLRAVRRTTPIAIRLLTMSVLSSPTVGDRSRGRTQQNRASRDDGAFKDRGDDVPESGHGSRRGLGADQGSVGSSHDPRD